MVCATQIERETHTEVAARELHESLQDLTVALARVLLGMRRVQAAIRVDLAAEGEEEGS